MIDGSGFNHPTNQNHLWWSSVCVPRLASLAHLHVCSSSKKYLFSFKRGSQYLIDFLIDFAFPEEVELVSVVGTDENEFLNFCVSFCETKKKSNPIRRVHPKKYNTVCFGYDHRSYQVRKRVCTFGPDTLPSAHYLVL